MSMDKRTDDLIETLARHEDALTELYGCYAIIFASRQDFWTKLAREEATHAAFLRVLRRYADDGAEITSEGGVSRESVASSLRFIEDQMDRARAENVSGSEALSIAFSIECALIEQQAFKTFRSDDIRVLRVLHRLESETSEHCAQLQSASKPLAVAA